MGPPADIFASLTRPWVLTRTLRSNHPSQPSGTCTGVATFVSLCSSDQDTHNDGRTKIQDMLYAESGTFEMKTDLSGTNVLKAPFEKKYIWRLHTPEVGEEKLSIFFVKQSHGKPDLEAGTDTQRHEVDYLFHTLLLDIADKSLSEATHYDVRARGDHLCVQDNYQSEYLFTIDREDGHFPAVQSWNMRHTVMGPKKDQVIDTMFTKGDIADREVVR